MLIWTSRIVIVRVSSRENGGGLEFLRDRFLKCQEAIADFAEMDPYENWQWRQLEIEIYMQRKPISQLMLSLFDKMVKEMLVDSLLLQLVSLT